MHNKRKHFNIFLIVIEITKPNHMICCENVWRLFVVFMLNIAVCARYTLLILKVFKHKTDVNHKFVCAKKGVFWLCSMSIIFE